MAQKILVVDDEQMIVKLIGSRLVKQGYEVISANDGEEALQTARTEKPDLIILDVMMPKLDGFKVCRLLKFDEEFKETPIIMYSAKDMPEDKQTGTETGADAYITKTEDVNVILAKVAELLNR